MGSGDLHDEAVVGRASVDDPHAVDRVIVGGGPSVGLLFCDGGGRVLA